MPPKYYTIRATKVLYNSYNVFCPRLDDVRLWVTLPCCPIAKPIDPRPQAEKQLQLLLGHKIFSKL